MDAKKIVIAAAIGLALAACGNKDSSKAALDQAVKSAIAETVGGAPDKVKIYNMEQTGSVTLGEELERRRNAINLRIKKNGEYLVDYKSQGMTKNAAKKEADIAKDRERLKGLEEIASSHAAQTDSVIALIYKLSGEAVNAEGGKVKVDNMYAAVTPDLRVLAFDKDARALLKSTGHAIPGYDGLYAAGGED